MTNHQKPKSTFLKSNWKWLMSISIVVIIIILLFTLTTNGVTTDLIQAYTDTTLYENALQIVKADERVTQLLGEIKPIDKLAILEGQVEYSNDNKTVNTTIRLIGTKGKGNLDIIANKINGEWIYTKIAVRIKNPPESKQTIIIVPSD